MILSIIVPVYNVEVFLPRCLDSLLRQGMKLECQNGELEYEIICVDDGSSDDSPKILLDYARRYPSLIKVIIQENQGLGLARNVGLAIAQGEYIAFVDSDDYLLDGGLGYICSNFLKENPDVVHYDYCIVYTDGRTLANPGEKVDGTILYNGDGVKAYNNWPLYTVWQNLYRRDFLLKNNIKFENLIYEDAIFNFTVFQGSPHLISVSSNIYRYEKGNVNSVTTIANKDKIMFQLDQSLFQTICIIESYLQKGHKDLAPAAHKMIKVLLTASYERLVCVILPFKQWRKYTNRLKKLSAYTASEPMDNKGCARLLAKVIIFSSKSYLFYVIICTLRIIWQFFKAYIYGWKKIPLLSS